MRTQQFAVDHSMRSSGRTSVEPKQERWAERAATNDGARILVVEDERIVALDLMTTLRRLGYEVHGSVASGAEAIEAALQVKPQLVLMDIRLSGDIDGVAAAEAIVKALAIPVVFLTAYSDNETLRRAKAVRPYSYLLKPFRAADLRCAIEVSLHRHALDMQLRERENWLSTTLKSIHDGVISTDLHERIEFMNPVAESMTGWSAQAALGCKLDDVVRLLVESTGLRLRMKDGELLRDHAELHARSGERRSIQPSAATIRDDVGREFGRVFVLHDTTERRAAQLEVERLNADLERRVHERTKALEAANRELTTFSYAMAHDLRSPLRVIDGFSQLVIEDYGGKLGKEGVELLSRVRATVQRMAHLIDDLLKLAQLSQAEIRTVEVDLSDLVAELGRELASAHINENVRLIVQPEVRALADRSLLRAVLSNLLANAWKFTSQNPNACVEFGASTQYGRTVYFVRDNGVGFDMQHADRMFMAFERLHGAEYTGDGVGLAIVDRAVRRLGGHVWAVSAPNEGATFFFTIHGDDA